MNNRNIVTAFVFLYALSYGFMFDGCSSAVTIVSDWKKSDMTIDGKQQDWEGSLYDLKKNNVTIGIRNDAENLYLCFISYDQGVRRQIMNSGFTVWFDPTGGTNKQYGVKFPVGRLRGAQPMRKGKNEGSSQMSALKNSDNDNFQGEDENPDNMRPPMPPGTIDTMLLKPGFGKNDEMMQAMPNNALREIQFLGPEVKDVQQSTTLELKTMKVQVGTAQREFVYELQVPLHRTDDFPFTIIPTGRNILGIGFKAEDNSSNGMDGHGGLDGGQGGPPPGGGSGGPSGGRGGPHPGGGSGGGGGNSFNSSELIDLWTKVVLAQRSAGEKNNP